MIDSQGRHNSIHVLDSHTEGEPTRVILSGGPDLGQGTMMERMERFRSDFDGFRSGVICEPRGSEVLVGALLQEPVKEESSAAVIYFNDAGYLGMCGHGTIGVVTTLAYLGRIKPGWHKIETPVGDISACLNEDGSVTVENVPSYRYRAAVPVDVPGLGRFVGDVAWAGNWFFLIGEHPFEIKPSNSAQLIAASTAIRNALHANGITGASGEYSNYIDHIEFFSEPGDPANSSRSFVLCPGRAFDRSPCGTGTSAKLSCLYADGKLAPGQTWRQESILGTVFEGTAEPVGNGVIVPRIRGRAWITGESKLIFAADDPFSEGIRF
jgi:4-hydroxyproline epimerase